MDSFDTKGADDAPVAKRVTGRDPVGVIGVPTPPWPQCTISIGYPLDRPELVTVSAETAGCPDAQTALALSIMVTTLLRAAKAGD